MSTFSGLNTAMSGLNAARAGLDVVGQNITNANSAGYTRQRVETSAATPLGHVGPMAPSTPKPGQGVFIGGVSRLGDIHLDARVHSTASVGGYATVRAGAMLDIESVLAEPGAKSLSARMDAFWDSWQDLSNRPNELAAAGVVLEEAGVLVEHIASGYRAIEDLWTRSRADLQGHVDEINATAVQIAELNTQIRSALNAGQSANELLDRRSELATSAAKLAGGTVQHNDDGTINVLVAGNALVAGTSARSLVLAGATDMAGSATAPVRLEWAHRPGAQVAMDGGQIAGALSVLAPADSGGPIAQAAASFDEVATALAATVNAIHAAGATKDGTTGLAFFTLAAGRPAALGLAVVPTGADQVAAGKPGAGGSDGSVADAISQVGLADDGPSQVWAQFVTRVGVASSTSLQQAVLADVAATGAADAQLANASVDLDEENVSLMAYQRAYQGAARVMTAVDELLDTLINRTGRVGL